jgi:SAM-dependent methyltransferase
MPTPRPRATSTPSASRPPKRTPPPLTRANADRYDLYTRAVQSVESEIDFVDRTYRRLRGRHATRFREDFCAAAASACEWVRRRRANTALGIDLDPTPLAWGILNNLSRLTTEQRDRILLENGDVLKHKTDPGARPDIVNAMNFSYYCFEQRDLMLRYFRSVRDALAPGGIFFLDHYGGSDALVEQRETRRVGRGPRSFKYVWDQFSFDPITAHSTNYIHFQFNDGTQLFRAFRYDWRLWGLKEIQDILLDAGFKRVGVYWEDEDDDGEGTGVFRRRDRGTADYAHVNYIVAEK